MLGDWQIEPISLKLKWGQNCTMVSQAIPNPLAHLDTLKTGRVIGKGRSFKETACHRMGVPYLENLKKENKTVHFIFKEVNKQLVENLF